LINLYYLLKKLHKQDRMPAQRTRLSSCHTHNLQDAFIVRDCGIMSA